MPPIARLDDLCRGLEMSVEELLGLSEGKGM